MSRLTYWLAAGLLLVLVAGCDRSGADPHGTPQPGRSPSASFTPKPLAEYCGVQTDKITTSTLRTDAGDVLPIGWIGSGTTTAILLHETGGGGMCGFIDYGRFLAGHGVRVMLVDLCSYGRARCGDHLAHDRAAQVQLFADEARKQQVERLVLVGASMGGSVAAHAAARVRADAVVDLSGPVDFFELNLADDLPTLTMPTLFAFSPTDQSDLDKVTSLLPSVPAKTKRLMTGRSGHGYELLGDGSTTIAAAVLAWVKGDYP